MTLDSIRSVDAIGIKPVDSRRGIDGFAGKLSPTFRQTRLPDPDGDGRLERPTTSFTHDAVGNLPTLTNPPMSGTLTSAECRHHVEPRLPVE